MTECVLQNDSISTIEKNVVDCIFDQLSADLKHSWTPEDMISFKFSSSIITEGKDLKITLESDVNYNTLL